MTIEEQFVLFLDQLGGRSKYSLRNYRLRLNTFVESNGKRKAEEITRADINRWNDSIQERGYAEATLAGYRQAMKAFISFCLGQENPASHIKTGSFFSKRNKIPPEKNVEACSHVALAWLHSEVNVKVRNATIFLLSKGSGLRLREIQELKLSDVQQSIESGPDVNGMYTVNSHGKTKDVLVRYGRVVAAAFQRWMEIRPLCRVDRLFVTCKSSVTAKDMTQRFRPMSRSAIHKAFMSISSAAGLSRAIQSHALRHRLGDKLTREYGPKIAAMALNHADWMSASTAIAFYHHPDQEDVSMAIASLAEEFEETGQQEEINKLFGID